MNQTAPLGNDHYRLLAISGGRGGSLRSVVHLPLGGGVQALYGQNGVGKTQVLRLVERAINGTGRGDESSPFAHVHLRLVNPDSTDYASSALLRSIAEGASLATQALLGRQVVAHRDEEPAERYVNAAPSTLKEVVANLLSQTYPGDDPDGEIIEFLGRVDEVLDQGRFTLASIGTAEQPRWRVWLSYLPTGSDVDHASLPAPIPDSITGPARQRLAAGHQVFDDYTTDESEATSTAMPWAQMPVIDLGFEIGVRPADIIGGSDDEHWTGSDATLAQAQQAVGLDPHAAPVNERGVLDKRVAAEIDRVTGRANADLQKIFDPAPNLLFDIGGPADWIRGDLPHWACRLEGVSDPVPMESALSDAELRWARITLSIAEMQIHNRPTIVICDEPEQGLHIRAERRLPEALTRIARREEVGVLTASHSHYMLAYPSVKVIHVDRVAGDTVIDPNNPISLVDAESRRRSERLLGLRAAELQSLMQVAVVVEGLHDETVFAQLLRTELDEARASIFPLHGGKTAASLAEARLMIDGSDAPILVVLDNLTREVVEPTWQQLTEAFVAGRIEEAKTIARHRFPGGDEMKFLRQLALNAIDVGSLDRLEIFGGLKRPDVICYLPEDLLLTRGKRKQYWHWDRILTEWKADVRDFASIKDYVAAMQWFPPVEEPVERHHRIRDAAEAAVREDRERHPDLVALGERIVELSRRPATA